MLFDSLFDSLFNSLFNSLFYSLFYSLIDLLESFFLLQSASYVASLQSDSLLATRHHQLTSYSPRRAGQADIRFWFFELPLFYTLVCRKSQINIIVWCFVWFILYCYLLAICVSHIWLLNKYGNALNITWSFTLVRLHWQHPPVKYKYAFQAPFLYNGSILLLLLDSFKLLDWTLIQCPCSSHTPDRKLSKKEQRYSDQGK